MRNRCSIITVSLLAGIFYCCKSAHNKSAAANKQVLIDNTGTYLSSDTLQSINSKYKNEVAVNLLKFNRDFTVQTSKQYIYEQGGALLNNITITNWLNSETSYYYKVDGERKIVVSCNFKMPKKVWNDFASASTIKVYETFLVKGDTLIRQGKSNANFRKIYILHKDLTNNHKTVAIGNACK